MDPEPRPDVPSGHMPNSFSVPFDTFLQKREATGAPAYTLYADTPAIKKSLIAGVGEDLGCQIIQGERPIVTTCGSGMTACVIWLGLTLLGVPDIKLYDEVRCVFIRRSISH